MPVYIKNKAKRERTIWYAPSCSIVRAVQQESHVYDCTSPFSAPPALFSLHNGYCKHAKRSSVFNETRRSFYINRFNVPFCAKLPLAVETIAKIIYTLLKCSGDSETGVFWRYKPILWCDQSTDYGGVYGFYVCNILFCVSSCVHYIIQFFGISEPKMPRSC